MKEKENLLKIVEGTIIALWRLMLYLHRLEEKSDTEIINTEK
jgi:hypothetical protein